MGLDVHAMNFLRYARGSSEFGAILTLGRQGLDITEGDIARVFGAPRALLSTDFCEDFLRVYFGASLVESVDASDFESATHIRDMNEPCEFPMAYDTVLDFGTLEHVFNVPQAIMNAASACCLGGRVIHVLPANGQCGHGFYQFSPELFYSLYSEQNGFAETEVFVAELTDERHWFAARRPENGVRVYANSVSSSYVMSITRKVERVAAFRVQQSDYVDSWKRGEVSRTTTKSRGVEKVRSIVKSSAVGKVAGVVYRLVLAETSLGVRNPGLVRVNVDDACSFP